MGRCTGHCCTAFPLPISPQAMESTAAHEAQLAADPAVVRAELARVKNELGEVRDTLRKFVSAVENGHNPPHRLFRKAQRLVNGERR